MPGTRKGDDELDKDVLGAGAGDEEETEEGLDLAAADGDDDDDELEDLPASAQGRASAVRLLEFLLEKKALALHAKKPGTELIEKVGRLLESPAPVKARAARLSEEIVDSEDVDDLFVDDEVLIELLKRW
ncbi:MAG: hypothetical protein M3Y87_08040 [Myxococcota bacterium]|nr:hypothetical protein [Myxococcota bacterium]